MGAPIQMLPSAALVGYRCRVGLAWQTEELWPIKGCACHSEGLGLRRGMKQDCTWSLTLCWDSPLRHEK